MNTEALRPAAIFRSGGDSKPVKKRDESFESLRRRATVGIRISPQQVRPIVKALGAYRDFRESEEMFHTILDEGEEATARAWFELCRK